VRLSRILHHYGILQEDNQTLAELDILEAGCGVGTFSAVLSLLGAVYSFDYSENGIKKAKELFGQFNTINFFVADGTRPEKISEIKGKKFDLIVLMEFHPVARMIVDIPKPLEIIGDYYELLKDNGLMVIEHGLPRLEWQCEEYFQTEAIIKKFNAEIMLTKTLEKYLFAKKVLSKYNFPGSAQLLHMIKALLDVKEKSMAFFKNRELSKTMVIKKVCV